MPKYIPYTSHLEFGNSIDRSLIVLPIGSLEQHCEGPLGSDALIAEALAFRACLLLESSGLDCLILPTLYYGFSPEWLKSQGTISLSIESLKGVLDDIVYSLARHGAKRIAIVNGHGGNSGLLEAIARQLYLEHGVLLGIFDYWRLAGLRLGHCDDIEKDLLSNLLGLNIDCSCKSKATVLPYRVSSQLPPDTGIEGSTSPGYRVIVNKMARALEEFYNRAPDELLAL